MSDKLSKAYRTFFQDSLTAQLNGQNRAAISPITAQCYIAATWRTQVSKAGRENKTSQSHITRRPAGDLGVGARDCPQAARRGGRQFVWQARIQSARQTVRALPSKRRVGSNQHPHERTRGVDEARSANFYITDHYLNYPYVLVRLSTVRPDVLRKMVVESWRRNAPAKLVAAYKPEAE